MSNITTEFNLLCTSRKPFQEKSEGLIKLLSNALEIKRVDEIKNNDLCFYVMDMSNYKIKVSSRTLFVIPNTERRKDGVSTKDIIDKMKSVINLGIKDGSGKEGHQGYPDNFREQITFVFYLGDGRVFESLYQDSLYNIIVLGQKGLLTVIEGGFPRKVFIETIKECLSFSKISPYRFLGPVSEEMFYGRKMEIDGILSSEKSFAVVGSRGIGKTSLLQQLFRVTNKEYTLRKKEKVGSPTVLFNCLDISDNALVTEGIIKHINIREISRWQKGVFSLRDFFRRMSKWHESKIILFLDEVDALVASTHASTQGRILYNELRSASDQGYLRVVMSGYRDLFQDVFNQKAALYNFLEPLRLNELGRRDASALILEPMKELGISFKEENRVVDYLLGQSGCYPRILQFYCQHLLGHLDKEKRDVIGIGDIHDIENSAEIVNHLVDVFMASTTKVEQLFVYVALSFSEKFKTEELHQELKKKGISVSMEKVDREIQHLDLSNIINRRGNEIWFSYKILPYLLKKYNVKYRIGELMEDSEVISKLKGFF